MYYAVNIYNEVHNELNWQIGSLLIIINQMYINQKKIHVDLSIKIDTNWWYELIDDEGVDGVTGGRGGSEDTHGREILERQGDRS